MCPTEREEMHPDTESPTSDALRAVRLHEHQAIQTQVLRRLH